MMEANKNESENIKTENRMDEKDSQNINKNIEMASPLNNVNSQDKLESSGATNIVKSEVVINKQNESLRNLMVYEGDSSSSDNEASKHKIYLI